MSWIAAVAFSARAKTQMKTDRVGLDCMVSGVGSLLLFAPLGRLWPRSAALG